MRKRRKKQKEQRRKKKLRKRKIQRRKKKVLWKKRKKKRKKRKTALSRGRKKKVITEGIIQRLIEKGKERGFVTYSEILQEVPNIEEDVKGIEDLFDKLEEEGIKIEEVREYLRC